MDPIGSSARLLRTQNIVVDSMPLAYVFRWTEVIG